MKCKLLSDDMIKLPIFFLFAQILTLLVSRELLSDSKTFILDALENLSIVLSKVVVYDPH